MRRALALLVFLPALALAQPVSNNCKFASATCQAKHFVLSTGGDLLPPSDLGASLGSASKRFTSVFAATFKDGSSVNRLIFSTAQGNTYVGAVVDGASAIGHQFNTVNALSTTGSKLVNFQNSSTEKSFIRFDGALCGVFTNPQCIDMNYGSNGIRLTTGSTAGGDIYMADKDGQEFLHANKDQITAQSLHNPVPVVHVAQTANPVAMEFGRSAAAGTGLLAVTFATAFGGTPSCVCTDENATPTACGITVAPSTSAVTFYAGAARADTVDWQCSGAK